MLLVTQAVSKTCMVGEGGVFSYPKIPLYGLMGPSKRPVLPSINYLELMVTQLHTTYDSNIVKHSIWIQSVCHAKALLSASLRLGPVLVPWHSHG